MSLARVVEHNMHSRPPHTIALCVFFTPGLEERECGPGVHCGSRAERSAGQPEPARVHERDELCGRRRGDVGRRHVPQPQLADRRARRRLRALLSVLRDSLHIVD